MDHSPNHSSSSDDEDETMPRPNQSRGRPPKRIVELDLSAVINNDQKAQLQRLVSGILDDLQKQLRDNFDSMTPGQVPSDQGINPPKAMCLSIPNPLSEKYRDMYSNADSIQATATTTAPDTKKENVKPIQENEATAKATATATATLPEWRAPKSPEDLQEMFKKTDIDVLQSSLSELKRDSLAHFNKWRVNVMKRIGDIVIKNGGTTGNVVSQQPATSSGSAAQPANPRGGSKVAGLPSGSNACAEKSNATLIRVYPPVFTSLKDCPKEKRALIMHCMLLILLGLDQYSLNSRLLLVKLASSLNVPMWVLLQDEVRVSRALSGIIMGIPTEEIAQRRAEESKNSRRWRPGIVGGAQGGNTGTLAAPLVEAGIGTVFGGLGLNQAVTAVLLGPMNESTIVVGTLFGLYGARQGSKSIEAHGRDLQDFGMIPLHGSSDTELIDPKDAPVEDRRMRVTIAVPGLLTERDDYLQSWKFVGQQNESYVMRWELDALTKAGTALDTVVKSVAWYEANKEINSENVFDRLTRSYWPTDLVKISKVIENNWTVGMVRAEKAGAVLADVLINRLLGERPVTLIGYSLGARAIYACLMALSEKRAFGLVENVVVMGTPCPTEVRAWTAMKSVVTGRLINVYSKNDYLLGFLHRGGCWQYGVAGLQKIEGAPNVENFDVSEVMTNHLRYRHLVGSILKRIGWEDIDYNEVNKEQERLAVEIEAEKDLQEARDLKHAAKLAENPQKKKKKMVDESVRETMEKMRGVKLDSK
ncbi:DUF726-domain-containing protein [Hypoxylon sp. FL1857]|nr:DUF726-domain-containing protein [Hypoxylon sp. FL1857]